VPDQGGRRAGRHRCRVRLDLGSEQLSGTLSRTTPRRTSSGVPAAGRRCTPRRFGSISPAIPTTLRSSASTRFPGSNSQPCRPTRCPSTCSRSAAPCG
jgi:hypothetical protein